VFALIKFERCSSFFNIVSDKLLEQWIPLWFGSAESRFLKIGKHFSKGCMLTIGKLAKCRVVCCRLNDSRSAEATTRKNAKFLHSANWSGNII